MTNVLLFAEISARLLALLAIVHGVEFLMLARVTGARGVWRWSDLESEFGDHGSIVRSVLGLFLADRNFQWLNWFRIFVAITQFVSPSAIGIGILFVVQLLTMLRWLGSFNGGSDYMALLVFMLTTLALGFGAGLPATLCLWYIAAQLCLSYVKAGWVKVVNSEWRNGRALRDFVQSPTYAKNKLCDRFAASPVAQKCSAWIVIAFELSFPICLLSPKLAMGYLAAAFIFHAANAYVFGLNRFVLAWLAAYPALYFCSLSA